MTPQHMILFYVTDPMASAGFYERLLGHPPIDASPGFAMFRLNDGTMLGLWNKKGVVPAPDAGAGASELGFHVANDNEVDALFGTWGKLDVAFAQSPSRMDFGYTFTALDPDGHRLRVFAAA